MTNYKMFTTMFDARAQCALHIMLYNHYYKWAQDDKKWRSYWTEHQEIVIKKELKENQIKWFRGMCIHLARNMALVLKSFWNSIGKLFTNQDLWWTFDINFISLNGFACTFTSVIISMANWMAWNEWIKWWICIHRNAFNWKKTELIIFYLFN